MQNSCKASSHRPEQNSSFYFVEKAIDFPYVQRLYSDSVYSWALTGLPKAALQTSCSFTISVVIILLSCRDNWKCTWLSGMQGRQQELLTYFIFYIAFSITENDIAMNFHWVPPSTWLLSGNIKHAKSLQLSLFPENSVDCTVMSFLTQWKPSQSPFSALRLWLFQLNHW